MTSNSRIADALSGTGKTFSFEFFPPKSDAAGEKLYEAVGQLQTLAPSFVSVTYGAGGSTRDRTRQLVMRLQKEMGIETMAHLTCVGHTREELTGILENYKASGVNNIMALRGDPPQGQAQFVQAEGGFAYATQLVELIQSIGGFTVGCAGYPEGHPETADKALGLTHLRQKIDAGADFIVTQLFFDVTDFLRFRDACVFVGIDKPVIAGIMPILSVAGIRKMTGMCGARIPQELERRLANYEDDPSAIRRIGIAWATSMCERLLQEDVKGIHFYTLNQSSATKEIFMNLGAKTAAHLGAQ